MLKVVADTNVLVSGLLKGRTTRPLLNALINDKFLLVTSQTLLEELAFTLSKPRLAVFIPESDSASFISLLRERATIVLPRSKLDVCRDPDDNAVLECAVTGHASVIISGDKDLLVLSPFKSIKICTPAEFLDILEK